ncbi:HIT domain-containing protein [Vibrio sp. HN007]|uniref:HIT domain-containing protein n=1 Tax=Vibrio iocasae TaxID=3098914 RepID=UPI0035D4B6EE
MSFTLHPRLQLTSTLIGELPLCSVLLCKDNSVPWVILVPKVEGIRELYQLPIENQHQYLIESQYVCKAMEHLFSPDKMNIATIGNLVPQLHVHHVARYVSDDAWPGTIWENTSGVDRSEEHQKILTTQLREELSRDRSFHFISA